MMSTHLVDNVTGSAPRASGDLDTIVLPRGERRVLLLKEEPLVVLAVRLHLVTLELSLPLSTIIHKVVVDCLVVQGGPLPLDVNLLSLIASHVRDEGR